MKYQAPFGSPDVDASYVDKNVPGAVAGSRVPAKAVEQPQRELHNLILKSGFVPSDADVTQILQAVRGQSLNYLQAAGTANALTVAPDPQLFAYAVGLPLRIKIGAAANTAAATLNVSGLGNKPIKRFDGSDLVAGDLAANEIVSVIYDGVNFRLASFARSEVKKSSGDAFKQASTMVLARHVPLVPNLANNILTVVPTTSLTDDGQGDWQVVGSQIRCVKAGRFLFVASLGANIPSGPNVAAFTLGVYRNGGEFIASSTRLSTDIVNTTYGGGAVVTDVIVGDYFEFRAYIGAAAPGATVINHYGSLGILRLAS